MARSRWFSLPAEHGAYLTLLGAATLGILAAPERTPASGAALALAAAFVGRGPVDALWTRHRAARMDVPLLIASAILVLLGTALTAGTAPLAAAVVLASALVLMTGTLVVSRLGGRRAESFIAIGMAAMAGAVGLVAWAGGAPPRQVGLLAGILSTHSLASVWIVRSLVLPRERPLLGARIVSTLAALGLSAVVLVLVGASGGAAALAPRVALVLAAPLLPGRAPWVIGLSETVALALCVAALAL